LKFNQLKFRGKELYLMMGANDGSGGVMEYVPRLMGYAFFAEGILQA